MREWTTFIAEHVIVCINVIVLVTVIFGTVTAVAQATGAIVSRSASKERLREIYLHYGHWLIAALTFQIAADIVETSIAPTWQEVGRLGAVSAIRVFLNFFLERDLSNMRQDSKVSND